ncbi:hypothetical protein F8M41_009649 [Gigaspora margarita]|uniref:Uncharacterized protein n=1 Tax=Gigaspora margarita TaxID=4874 RepID=A0A8H3X234_GIGMA|nr:hypothetical protein F8M41_009649 [Gigaspora margarita]
MSLFVVFCFSKNVSENDKCISETALYRINYNIDKFKKITFKGFIASSEFLVMPFKKNSIILMIGRYAYEDAKYIILVQTVSISSSEGDCVLISEDLLSSSPLLIYFATVVADSYISDNQVLSVIGRLKIGSKKFFYILASDIEWTYVSNDPLLLSTTTNAKEISEVEFNKQLDGIEEKYAMLTSQVLQKRQNTRQNINLHNSNNKRSNNKTTSLNFVDIISQVQKETSSVKIAYTRQSSSTNNLVSTFQNTSQHIPSHATRIENEEDAAFVSNDDPTELVKVQIQEATPEIKEKHGKILCSTKK